MSKTIVAKIGFTNYYTATIQLGLILLILFATSYHSFLLFHSLVETAGVAILFIIFIITWNVRRYLDNNYFLLLGIAFLFVGGLAIFHLLTYKGMGIFPGNEANTPTQLWIAERYLIAFSFLVAPFFIRKKIDVPAAVALYAAIFFLLLFSIFRWQNFPAAYIDGQGLTTFKKDSEYVISFLFIVSAILLYSKREHFDRSVYQFIIFSLFAAITAEITFTEYVNVYGSANIIGHLFLFSSFYFIYLGIIEIALRKPSSILYKKLRDSHLDIKSKAEKLYKLNATLEEKVRKRTYDLQKSNEKLNAKNILLKLASEAKSRKLYLNELTKLIKEWTGCTFVGIRIINDSGSIPYNSYLGFSQQFWQSENWLSVKNDHCICGRVMQGKPDVQDLRMMSSDGSFSCNDTFQFFSELSEMEKNRFRGNCIKQGFMSLGIIPVKHGQQIIGLIHIADKESGKLSSKKIEFIESLSSLVGTAIHKYNTVESLDKSKRALAVLSEGNHILVHAQNEKELLQNVCKVIVEKGGYVIAWIGYVKDKSTKEPSPVAQAGIGESSLKNLISIANTGASAKGSSLIAIITGKTYVRKNIQIDPTYSYLRDQAVKFNFKSSISIPLKNNKIILGAITIYAKESVAFDQEEIKLLEELANDMAFGINNLRIYAAKKRSEKQLIESYQHLGLINRKISILSEMGKKTKNNKNLVAYILKTAINIAQADLGLLYKFNPNKSFTLLYSSKVSGVIDAELKTFSSKSYKFLEPLIKSKKKMEIRSDLYNLGCFNIKGQVRCYLAIPLTKKEPGEMKGVIFLGFMEEKKLFTQDLEFYDVFERHASDALFNAKIL